MLRIMIYNGIQTVHSIDSKNSSPKIVLSSFAHL